MASFVKTFVYLPTKCMANIFIFFSALYGFIGVALGAYGAHKLKPYLNKINKFETYQTAVEYQFYHTCALLFVALLMSQPNQQIKCLQGAGILFAVGILIFSGSLYMLCLTNNNKWGMLTPFGGMFFLIGWVMLGLSVFSSNKW
jgi:uncharacterized membrane protein YgdD (TMEM256/DUF423 family)